MSGIVCGLAMLAGGYWGWPAPVVLAAILIVTLLAWTNPTKLIIACVVLSALAAARVHAPKETNVPPWLDGQHTLVGDVAGAPIDNGTRQSFVVRARPAEAVDDSNSAARICVTAPPFPRVGRGDRLLLTGDTLLLDEASDRVAGLLRYRSCAGSLSVDGLTIEARGSGVQRAFDRVRRRMTDALLTAAPGDAGALLSGLATGDDTALTATRRNAFIVTGTSHVTAVSGSNLSLLIAMVVTGTAFAGSVRLPWRLAIFTSVVWSYVALVGWSPPATRAAAVATLALVARAIGRRPDFVTLALVGAAMEVIIRPVDIHSLAFQLSTVSAISLVLGLGGRAPSGVSGWLIHGIAATAVTQAATSALLVPTFGRLSIYAIPTNLVIGPMCSAAFPLALLAGLVGIASPMLAAAFAFPAQLIADLVLAVVSGFARLPLADTGSSFPEWMPPSLWLAAGTGVVIAMSQECRGGIERHIRIACGWNKQQTAVAIGAAGGASAGLIISAIVR